MNYSRYSASDFALDEKFQKWVLQPDEETSYFWNNWLENNPTKKQEIGEAIDLIKTAGLSNDYEANQKYLSTWNFITEHAGQSEKLQKINPAYRFARFAAAFAGLALISGYFIWRNNGADFIEYKTTYGEVKEVMLNDGSKVTLNANSTLKLDDDWIGLPDRKVFLEGEAFFEIVKTKDKKSFIVSTPGKLEVQVLGTAFNVNTRRQKTLVYLQSGNVKINAADGEVMLNPGQLAEYEDGKSKVEVKQGAEVEAEKKLGWKNNLFIFNDTPLYTIIEEIEDNYGLKVTMTDTTLGQKRFTAKVPRKDVDVLLEVLSETLEITVVKNANEIVISP